MNVLPVDPTGGLPDQSAPTLTNGTVIASGQVRSSTVTALVGTTPTLNVALGQVFTITTSGATTISLSNPSPGAQVFLIVTGGGAHTITFGANIKGMGQLLTAASGNIFTLHYICDGTSLLEVSRTAAFTDTT
jgi:hypothetical protein